MVAPYLQQLLSQDYENSIDERVTLGVTMEVLDHSKNNLNLLVESYITMWYVGHEPIQDLPLTLDEMLARQNYGFATLFQDVTSVQSTSKEFVFAVSTVRDETAILYSVPPPESNSSAANKGLVAAVVLLVMALIFVSCVLVWVAGGCPVLKEQIKRQWYRLSVYVCRRTPEDKDDAATTASGILGANPSYTHDDENEENAMPAGFTPNRGVFREQDCDDSQILSPMSTNTDYSSASRAVPLGIQPSLHLRSTPPKLTVSTNPYHAKRNSNYS